MIDSLYRLLGRLGFTDPLHPPIVHIPIGLVIGAFVFFAVALLFKRRQLVLTARHASILALVFAFPSILFGALDWIHFYHAAPIPAIRIKMALAAALLILLTLGIILGGKGRSRNAALLVVYALSLLDVVALGYFGASLIYSRGSAASPPSAVSAAAPPAAAPAAATPVGFEAGRTLFADNCQACHPGGGNSVYPKLPVMGSKRLASLADFESFVRAPTMPDGKSGDMPPFGTDALGSVQVKDLYAYVSVQFR
jgi:mono/diheme cytochrome c family protein